MTYYDPRNNEVKAAHFHWNGSGWSSNTVGGEITTLAGWGDHTWAAGLNDIRTKVLKRTRHGPIEQVTGRFTLLKFAGGNWVLAPTAHPTIATPGDDQFAVAGPGGRVWVVTAPAHGRSTLRYYTGRRWSDHPVPPGRAN